MEPKDMLGAAALVVAILNFVWTRHTATVEAAKQTAELGTQLRDLRYKVDNIEVFLQEVRTELPKIDLFWDLVRQEFPKMLIHPYEPARDLLLAKMSNDTITLKEAEELDALLIVEYEHTDKKSTEAFINLMTRHVLQGMIKHRRGTADAC